MDKPASMVVYAHLCLLGNFKTRVTTSDWHEVTSATGYSKPTVMRAMKVLREAKAVVRHGDSLFLPKDRPGLKYETDESQIRDQSGSNLRLAPLLTESSEKDVEDDAPTEVDDLNLLLASRYSAFSGTPIKNHRTARWKQDMRLLLERGPTDWACPQSIMASAVERRINGIFDHLTVHGTSKFCWAAVIRSPSSLRKHWDQIGVAAKAFQPPSEFRGTVSTPEDPDNDDYYL